MFALDDKWIWDFWFAQENGRCHMYFLQADKALQDPDLRHWHVNVGHAVSQDLKNWEYLGPCFAPAPSPAWDDFTTWTGSVVEGEGGLWHFFYTGTSRAENGLKQRIGHATSRDLHNWQRVSDAPLLDIDPAVYEEYTPGRWHERAFRDPWVMRDPQGAGWLMFFTARSAAGEADANGGGTIGLARSDDLFHWELCPPVYEGGDFGHLEVPQVIMLDGKWYCLFCTVGRCWSQKFAAAYKVQTGGDPVGGTHYLTAPAPTGPWTTAPGPFLDGDAWLQEGKFSDNMALAGLHHVRDKRGARYSGKIVMSGEGPVFMGFENIAEEGGFTGRVSDPVPMQVDAAGRLHLSLPEETARAEGAGGK
ncbi:MAG: levansucrase [Alphaproteobacteria bacterium]|nr:levansucrase [Alphaproteobacteria bacterium]